MQSLFYSVDFPPGAYGLELEPVISSSQCQIGCRVKDYYFEVRHVGIDQSYLVSNVKIGDIIYSIGSENVSSSKFLTILEKLRSCKSVSRCLVFKSITSTANTDMSEPTTNESEEDIWAELIQDLFHSLVNEGTTTRHDTRAKQLFSSPPKGIKFSCPMTDINESFDAPTAPSVSTSLSTCVSPSTGWKTLKSNVHPFPSPREICKLAKSPSKLHSFSPPKSDDASEGENLFGQQQLMPSFGALAGEGISQCNPAWLHSLRAAHEFLGARMSTYGGAIANEIADVAIELGTALGDKAELVLNDVGKKMPLFSAEEVCDIMEKKNSLLNELSRKCLLLGCAEEKQACLAMENDMLRVRERDLCEQLRFDQAEISALHAHVRMLMAEREVQSIELDRLQSLMGPGDAGGKTNPAPQLPCGIELKGVGPASAASPIASRGSQCKYTSPHRGGDGDRDRDREKGSRVVWAGGLGRGSGMPLSPLCQRAPPQHPPNAEAQWQAVPISVPVPIVGTPEHLRVLVSSLKDLVGEIREFESKRLPRAHNAPKDGHMVYCADESDTTFRRLLASVGSLVEACADVGLCVWGAEATGDQGSSAQLMVALCERLCERVATANEDTHAMMAIATWVRGYSSSQQTSTSTSAGTRTSAELRSLTLSAIASRAEEGGPPRSRSLSSDLVGADELASIERDREKEGEGWGTKGCIEPLHGGVDVASALEQNQELSQHSESKDWQDQCADADICASAQCDREPLTSLITPNVEASRGSKECWGPGGSGTGATGGPSGLSARGTGAQKHVHMSRLTLSPPRSRDDMRTTSERLAPRVDPIAELAAENKSPNVRADRSSTSDTKSKAIEALGLRQGQRLDLEQVSATSTFSSCAPDAIGARISEEQLIRNYCKVMAKNEQISTTENYFMLEACRDLLQSTGYILRPRSAMFPEEGKYVLDTVERRRALIHSLDFRLPEALQQRRDDIEDCESFTRCHVHKIKDRNCIFYEYIDLDSGEIVDAHEYEKRYMAYISPPHGSHARHDDLE